MLRREYAVTAVACLIVLVAGPALAQHADDAFVGQMAPELKVEEWFNSAPLTLEGLRGNVVLLEFWAWDCPECAQAIPYVKDWHSKYADEGLVIVGVHTPRAEYEKDIVKLRETIETKSIEYPVATDHEYLTWLDYLNNAWPSHFVVDREGVIQLSHTGTGRYEETEQVIQRLLSND